MSHPPPVPPSPLTETREAQLRTTHWQAEISSLMIFLPPDRVSQSCAARPAARNSDRIDSTSGSAKFLFDKIRSKWAKFRKLYGLRSMKLQCSRTQKRRAIPGCQNTPEAHGSRASARGSPGLPLAGCPGAKRIGNHRRSYHAGFQEPGSVARTVGVLLSKRAG